MDPRQESNLWAGAARRGLRAITQTLEAMPVGVYYAKAKGAGNGSTWHVFLGKRCTCCPQLEADVRSNNSRPARRTQPNKVCGHAIRHETRAMNLARARAARWGAAA
jgi:hypothetical protein